MLRNALEWQSLLASRQVTTRADLARRQGVSRAWVTRVLSLLQLSPGEQRMVLDQSKPSISRKLTGRALESIAQAKDFSEQSRLLKSLISKMSAEVSSIGLRSNSGQVSF